MYIVTRLFLLLMTDHAWHDYQLSKPTQRRDWSNYDADESHVEQYLSSSSDAISTSTKPMKHDAFVQVCLLSVVYLHVTHESVIAIKVACSIISTKVLSTLKDYTQGNKQSRFTL